MKIINNMFIVLFVFSSFNALATDYYVRPVSGEYGLEDGSSYANAWDGFSNVNWATLDSDNDGTKLFVCGTHQETLTVGAGGEVGEVITIISCTTANGCSTDDPGKIDGDSRRFGIDSGAGSDYSYITVDGLEIYDFALLTNPAGIILRTSTSGNWIIQNCTFHDIGTMGDSGADNGRGIWLNASNVTVRENTFYDIGNNQIMITDYSGTGTNTDNNIIEKNLMYNSNHTLIEILLGNSSQSADGNIIRYNRLYHTDAYNTEIDGEAGHGIYMETGTSGQVENTYIYGNVIDGVTGSGIFFGNNVDGPVYVYNNSIHDCRQTTGTTFEGIRINGDNNATIYVKNNIAVFTDSDVNFLVNDTTNKTVDYNSWYMSSGNFANVSPTNYSVWNTYQSGTGFDANPSDDSAFADPSFVNGDTVPGDLTLTADSPMIDNGEDLGNNLLYCLDPDSSWPDNVTPVDCDSFGTSGWPIGAFEYEDGETIPHSGVSIN